MAKLVKISILKQICYNRPCCLRFQFARDSKMYQFFILRQIIEGGTTSVKQLLRWIYKKGTVGSLRLLAKMQQSVELQLNKFKQPRKLLHLIGLVLRLLLITFTMFNFLVFHSIAWLSYFTIKENHGRCSLHLFCLLTP